MTTENNPSQTPDTPSPVKKDTAPEAPESKAPAVDVEALKKQVREEAAALVAERDAKLKGEMEGLEANIRKKLAKQISGEPDAPEVDPLLKQLVQNPGEYAKAISDLTEQRIEQKKIEQQKQAAADAKAVEPFQKEYPELLDEHMDIVDALVGTNLGKGMERSEAIKAACETAAKKLKLKSVSERRKEGTYIDTAVPGVGGAGYGGEASFDDVSSASSFIDGLKAKASSRRRAGGKK